MTVYSALEVRVAAIMQFYFRQRLIICYEGTTFQ